MIPVSFDLMNKFYIIIICLGCPVLQIAFFKSFWMRPCSVTETHVCTCTLRPQRAATVKQYVWIWKTWLRMGCNLRCKKSISNCTPRCPMERNTTFPEQHSCIRRLNHPSSTYMHTHKYIHISLLWQEANETILRCSKYSLRCKPYSVFMQF